MTKYVSGPLRAKLKAPSVASKVHQATKLLRHQFMQLGDASDRDGATFWQLWTELAEMFKQDDYWAPVVPFVDRLILGTGLGKQQRRFITAETAESFATLAKTSIIESLNAYFWRSLHKDRFFASREMFIGRVYYLSMVWTSRQIRKQKKLRRTLRRKLREVDVSSDWWILTEQGLEKVMFKLVGLGSD